MQSELMNPLLKQTYNSHRTKSKAGLPRAFRLFCLPTPFVTISHETQQSRLTWPAKTREMPKCVEKMNAANFVLYQCTQEWDARHPGTDAPVL